MPGSNDRSERLAAALRANLSRRKAQARARRAGSPPGDEGDRPSADPANNGENPARDGREPQGPDTAKIVRDGEPG